MNASPPRKKDSARPMSRHSPVRRRRNGDFGKTVDQLWGDLPSLERRLLREVPRSVFAGADVAACLLGKNLWYPQLATYRDHLIESGERPHLWTFEFTPSAGWNASDWQPLSLTARLVRSRAGAIDRSVTPLTSPGTLDLAARQIEAGLSELSGAGYYDKKLGLFPRVASPSELRTDLSLIEIIAHWLFMLAHRDKVLADVHATGFEVHGYAEACSLCRERWGLRPFEAQWAPPFHPGCRCFAQPRFTST